MSRMRRPGPVELADDPSAWPDPARLTFQTVENEGLRAAAAAAAGFADAVIHEMMARGWRTRSGAPSATAVSRACGVHASTVGRVLRGLAWPDFETLVRLGRACDLPLGAAAGVPQPDRVPEPTRVEVDRPGAATKLVPAAGRQPRSQPAEPSRPAPRRPPAPPPPDPYAGLNSAERRFVTWLRDQGLPWSTFLDQYDAGRWNSIDFDAFDGVCEAYDKNEALSELLDNIGQ